MPDWLTDFGTHLPEIVGVAGFLFNRHSALPAIEDSWKKFIESLTPPYELQTVLFAALDGITDLVPADGYFAYTAEPGSGGLRLRVTRSSTGNPTVGPNYAGLAWGAPIRQAPLELPAPANPLSLEVDNSPTDPSLNLSCGPQVLLRAALAPHQSVSQHQRQALLDWALRLKPVLEIVVHHHGVTQNLESVALGASTQQRAFELAVRVERVLDLVCRLGSEALGSNDGYIAVWSPGSPAEILWRYGRADTLMSVFNAQHVHQHLPGDGYAVWSTPGLPGPAQRQGYQSLAYLPFKAPDGLIGAAVYASSRPLRPDAATTEILSNLSRNITQVLAGRQMARSLSQTYLTTLGLAAELLDAADPYNSGHHRQVASVAAGIAKTLGWPDANVRAIRLAGSLHDIGMVAVSLDIPLTQGALSPAARELVQQHPRVGADLLAGLPEDIAAPLVEQAIRQHHERWDGLGYPAGLKTTDISLAGRILACAEQFVARLSARSYRQGFPVSRALYEIERLRDSQLDPDVVDALLALYQKSGAVPVAPANNADGQ